jgi:hypothetical protein
MALKKMNGTIPRSLPLLWPKKTAKIKSARSKLVI